MASYFKGSYEDFDPFCKWQRGQERDILEIHLQGFTKEYLNVQLNGNGVLTISGENGVVENTKKGRFRKEIQMGKEHKTDQIRARFTNSILFLTIPKISISDQLPPSPPPPTKSPRFLGDGMIGKNIALGVAVVVAIGIIVGGLIIWKCISNPPILIY
ncbi:17.8 kDa class I heat shock protein-like [Humulus lupulus]|uniref:17.8 kDa class I heat shock protein-like n=1 Tax=Humulus lupulus TaxID=3486 RepID=UPI002B40E318|nr:17.8 kDa class I heat shock protein-like [Humulus lupulus]